MSLGEIVFVVTIVFIIVFAILFTIFMILLSIGNRYYNDKYNEHYIEINNVIETPKEWESDINALIEKVEQMEELTKDKKRSRRYK